LIAGVVNAALAKSPTMPNGRCRMRGGLSPGAPRVTSNKHGRYTAEAIASRREVAALIRAMRGLARATRS